MRFGIGLLGLAAAGLGAAPTAAQGLIAINFEVGTPADRVALLNLDNIDRRGDVAQGLANVEYVEPYRVDAQGNTYFGQWLRVQVNCRTREFRQLLYNSFADMGDTRDPAPFAASAPVTLPAESIIVAGMCNPSGPIKPMWQLLNTQNTEAPETRKVRTKDAQRHPWTTLDGGIQSFLRVRAVEMARRLGEGVAFWPQAKPVAGLPATTGFMAAPFQWQFNGRWTGPMTIRGGYVELPTVLQLADDVYFYSIVGAAQSGRVKPAVTLRYDLGIEVRCKPRPTQRIAAGEWFTLDGEVDLLPIPMKSLTWNEELFPFSRAICAKKFDAAARRHATIEPALAELVAAVKAP